MNVSGRQIKVPNRSALPKLPQPKDGKGPFTADLSYIGPDTVDTRLGSIPRSYSSLLSGREKGQLFGDGPKEATNRRGGSTDIWRAQPQFTSDGQVQMKTIDETIEADTYSKAGTSLSYGAIGAVIGGVVGFALGVLVAQPILGASLGAAVVGGVAAKLGHDKASGDHIRLEWQDTPVVEHDLQGYRYDRDENEDDEGNTEDYDHDFYPIIAEKTVGRYFKPVVVHYDASEVPQ